VRGGGAVFVFFFFNDTATTEIYTLSLHDALPISSLFVVLTLLLFWKHSENIKRLQTGTEGRIGAK